MSILTKVEVKSWRGRLFLAAVTAVLALGGATMLYPFMIMLAGAMRSDMDAADMGVVPRYWVDDAELFRKFLESKYNCDPVLMNRVLQSQSYRFRDAALPTVHERLTADFRAFAAEADLPAHWREMGGTEVVRGISTRQHERLVNLLRERHGDDLAAFNARMGASLRSWWLVSVRFRSWASYRTVMSGDPLETAYLDLSRAAEPHDLAYVNLSSHFLERMVYPKFGMRDVAAFNAAFGFALEDYGRFSLSERPPPPEQARYREAWLDFALGENVNLAFVRCDATDADYQAFLERRFGSVEALRAQWRGADLAAFADARLPGDGDWVPKTQWDAYSGFLKSLPPDSLRLVGPEFAWRRHLMARYGSPEAASAAHGVDYAGWEACRIPLAELEAEYVLRHKGMLRRHFAVRNFRIVLRQMFVQGRPFANTLVYVALALLFSLTLQPLVAYALSRFQPPGTWKFIFIFVATMAFPPMVGMIPQFLIVQRLGLLNTFAALVLPTTINGMLIFLLKGFFDSIPKDLYDAAVIDGASEFRIFWTITMAMSTPILAVVALQTFSGAWMSFMYPLIVCPDERMHVLAVWLQQFQQTASGSAVFASIIVSSVPSLLIFVFAQRTIMRGIAVPSEK